jgi:hypothetical protein
MNISLKSNANHAAHKVTETHQKREAKVAWGEEYEMFCCSAQQKPKSLADVYTLIHDYSNLIVIQLRSYFNYVF